MFENEDWIEMHDSRVEKCSLYTMEKSHNNVLVISTQNITDYNANCPPDPLPSMPLLFPNVITDYSSPFISS